MGSAECHVYICLFVIVALNASVGGLIKKWIPNTNFENPENWNVGRTPCQNDVVKFPESVGTVYVQRNVSVQEIILPMNGDIILANYVSLSFPSKQNGDNICQGQDVIYNGSVAQSWYDPENWCQIADPEGSCLSESWPRVDVERLPCEMDQAVFPRGASFHVDLESGVDIFLGKLTIRGKDYTTGQFKSYLNSVDGRQEFQQSTGHGTTSVNVKGELCSDPTGCVCGNDGGLLEQKVCAIQASRCPHPLCNSPLLPQGHCCHICGSVMMLDFQDGFKYKSLESMIHGIVPRDQKQDVKIMISRLHSEQVQVVIENVNGSAQVKSIVNLITKKIQRDSQGNSRYKISKYQVLYSDTDHARSPQAQTGRSKMMTPGSIASLVIAILVVIAIIALAMFCLIDRRKPNSTSTRAKLHLPVVHWPFRRFGQDEAGGAIELGPSQQFTDDLSGYPSLTDAGHGFDNPTYHNNNTTELTGHSIEGSTAAAAASGGATNVPISIIDLSEPTFVKKGQETAFANPMYGDQPKSEDASYLDSSLRINPVFSTDSLEEDSQI